MERFFAKISRNKFTALIEFGRPWNGITAWLFSLVGAGIFIDILQPISTIVLFTVTFFAYMGSSALNDIFDISVDAINMPYRPIIRGALKIKDGIIFAIICFIISLLISLSFSFTYFISVCLMVFCGVIYSVPPVSAKNRGLFGNFILSFATVFTAAYSGAVFVTNRLIPETPFLMLVLPLMLFFMFFSILKEFKDYRGDKANKKYTTVIKYGPKPSAVISIIGMLVLSIIFLYVFLLVFQNTIAALFISIPILLLLVLGHRLYKNPSEKKGEKHWILARFLMLILAIVLVVSII